MPIETRCPSCQKQYKLKDELGGKSVKCSNTDCRHVFTIPVKPNGKPAARKPAEVDADELAARLFSESPEDTKPANERTLTVECYNCNHKWPEPESKAGKFALCPECRTRNKVPELKKTKAADWRDATAGRRAGEKAPDLPEDLEAQQLKNVDIESLKLAGAIEAPEVEPRPLREYVLFIGVPLIVLGLIAGGVWWFMQSGQEGQTNALMAEAMKGIEELKEVPEPPAAEVTDDARDRRAELAKVSNDQRRLMRAALHIAHGEYQARLNTKESIREAVKAFANARRELEAVPKKEYERDALFGELAVAQLVLGGTEEQSAGELRLRWSPLGVKAPPVGSTAIDTVQNELRLTLSKMNEPGREVDKGVRLATVVRLTRELCKLGHADILFEIVTQAFVAEDHLEAQSLMLLAAVLSGGSEDKARRMAEQLKGQLAADAGVLPPWPVVALFGKLGMDDGKPLISRGEGNPSLVPRLAYAALAVTQGNSEESAKIASGPGEIATRLLAMAAIAELLDDPKPVLDEAARLAPTAGTGFRFIMSRLARVAADAKAADAAEVFARAIGEEGLRDWALAEAARGKWAASKSAAPTSELTLPTEANKLRVGQGWLGYQFARHNAAVTRDQAVAKEFDTWGDGKLRPFGYAGLALGLQDGK